MRTMVPIAYDVWTEPLGTYRGLNKCYPPPPPKSSTKLRYLIFVDERLLQFWKKKHRVRGHKFNCSYLGPSVWFRLIRLSFSLYNYVFVTKACKMNKYNTNICFSLPNPSAKTVKMWNCPSLKKMWKLHRHISKVLNRKNALKCNYTFGFKPPCLVSPK